MTVKIFSLKNLWLKFMNLHRLKKTKIKNSLRRKPVNNNNNSSSKEEAETRIINMRIKHLQEGAKL
jgi:hypothetical protein